MRLTPTDYEELYAKLGEHSRADVWQIVNSYRAYRQNSDGSTFEISIEIRRNATGFIVVAWDEEGRRVTPGEPTWDLEEALATADWSKIA